VDLVPLVGWEPEAVSCLVRVEVQLYAIALAM